MRLSGIERSNYIESNNLGRKSCPVSGIERIRYSGCFITLKKEGKNSGPTESSGFMGIPVLRGSGLEGFYFTIHFWKTRILKTINIRDNIAKKMKFIFDYINIMAWTVSTVSVIAFHVEMTTSFMPKIMT